MRAGIALATVAALAGAAAADPGDDDGVIERAGLVIDVRGGWGSFTRARCEGCDDYVAGFMALGAGAMLGRSVALMAGVEWGGHEGRTLVSLDLVSRWFIADRWWFDGGVGMGRVDIDEGREHATTFTGTAFQIAGGYDVYQGEAFAFDASLRSRYARTQVIGGDRTRGDVVVSFQLGLSWY